MKRWIRFLSLIIAAAMLLATPAFATGNTTPRASNYIMSTCVYLDQTTSTQFDVWYEIIALGQMDELGTCEIKIKESTNGQSWTTVHTFTPSDVPSMVKEDSYFHTGYVSYSGIDGRYYKAVITLFAENSSGRGEFIAETETIQL